jgi:opacity protein-like surface antigen
MMKKRSAMFLAAFAFLAFAVPAQAQTTLYVEGGAAFPTGNYGDVFNTGWMAAGGVLFGLGDSGFGVGGEVFYGQTSAKDEFSTLVPGAKTSPYGVMAIADYSFGSEGSLRPYLFGGLGLTVLRSSSDNFESDSESKFGYQFGAGLSFPIGLFVEGRYMGAENANYFGALAGWAFDL